LQGDERLVALTRRGNQAAYEALVARYQARLLAFCRHMLSSREDAEDVLQEVFAAAFNAMLADDRPINVRPWLYRIARNRCLNHLRKQTAIGVDSMDIHLAEHGTTTADKVHDREDFRQLVADVQTLAETQRTALLLREIDALSYEQIAEAMETTVPSVKSLLVRARVSLAEAAEARRLTCDEVRGELGEWAEGLARISAPVRRHVRTCQRCGAFKKQLRQTNKALAAVFPVGPLLLFKKFLLAQGASGAGAAAAGGAAATGGATVGGGAASSALSAGIGAVATKAAAGLAAVAIVTTGVAEVDHVQHHRLQRQLAPAQAVAATPPHAATSTAQVPAPAPAPIAVSSTPQKSSVSAQPATSDRPTTAAPSSTVPATPAATDESASVSTPSSTVPTGTQEGYDNTRLPDQPAGGTTTTQPDSPITAITPAPADAQPPAATVPAQPAAPAGTPTDPAPSPPTTTAPTAPAEPAPPADPPADNSSTSPSSTAPATEAEPAAGTTVPAD
jgi:RNA polymerase sigma factor (sigma-70 family)